MTMLHLRCGINLQGERSRDIPLDGRLTAVPIAGSTALEVHVAVPLFEARMLNGPGTHAGFKQQYDVTRDGQRFLLTVPLEETASSPITFGNPSLIDVDTRQSSPAITRDTSWRRPSSTMRLRRPY